MSDRANPFGGFDASDLFGDAGRVPTSKPEKGVAWLARDIDGKYYVPLEQVYELLESNSILPQTRAAISRRLQAHGEG